MSAQLRYSDFLQAITETIAAHATEIASLDQAIGDGDHLINLQRGLETLTKDLETLNALPFAAAFSQTGMTLMSTMGGASGSLYGSLFIAMGKSCKDQIPSATVLAAAFSAGVVSVKARGKADIGEKTMLDTLIPASTTFETCLQTGKTLEEALTEMKQAAETGMQSTRDMLATKGRASFLGERARGHIDAGARTSQLILSAIADVILEKN